MDAGLCCPEALDALISEAVGPGLVQDLGDLGLYEDWDPGWLTFNGALARWRLRDL